MDVVTTIEHYSLVKTESERADLRRELSVYLSQLLEHDFASLLQLLYRVDVSEQKLITTLRQNPGVNVGELLADLIIERQIQKQAARSSGTSTDSIPDDERW